MPKLAANLSFLFQELPFLDRFDAAARCGFRGVEFLFPYEYPAGDVARAARDAGVDIILFNLPAGDWAAGERGFAALPGQESRFRQAAALAFDYAAILQPAVLHVMAGLADGPHRGGPAWDAYVSNLRDAAAMAPPGVALTIEPINHRDMPGYFLNTTEQAMAVLAAVRDHRVRLQLDLYHAQITEGDLTRLIERRLPHVAHVQIAGVPDRGEPLIGEVNFAYLLGRLDDLGYDGWVGCEYRPAGATRDGLGWAAPYGVHGGVRG